VPTRVQIAKPDIVKHFDALPKRIFDAAEIATILEERRRFWRLAESMTLRAFIEFLSERARLKVVRFDFPYRPIIKYVWGEVPFYAIVLSLKPGCYLSHYTAMHLHELTDQIPKIVNVNAEQGPKAHGPVELAQERVDFAFRTPTRMCNNVAEYEGRQVRLLNGLYTGNSGVIEMPGPEGETLRVTDIERTLIDITVRPEYAGGPYEVLTAYKRASSRVSVNRLAALLKKIDYIYPYHQAIGFYLEAAGTYRKPQIDLFARLGTKCDFYLTHQITAPEYSSKWRLYYPKGLS
jgi:predicted transcriptional regulator of viral defense system